MKCIERTLEDLRNSLQGKVHVYLKDESTMKRFFSDAESQGWMFGAAKPSDSPLDSIVSLKEEKQLSFLGIAGRICFQTNGGGNSKRTYHRIDYAKYKDGNDDYYFRDIKTNKDNRSNEDIRGESHNAEI